MATLPTTKNDDEAIQQLKALRNGESVKDTFISLITKVCFDNLDGGETHIPYLGKLKIFKTGDIVDKGKKEAQLDITLNPSKFLIRLIGQISDREETDIDKFFIDNLLDELEKIESNQ